MIDLLLIILNNLYQNICKNYNINKSVAIDIPEVAPENEISKTESELSSMIDELTANKFDMKGLMEFKSLLEGDSDGSK